MNSGDEGEFNKFARPSAERRSNLSEDDHPSRQSSSEESTSAAG